MTSSEYINELGRNNKLEIAKELWMKLHETRNRIGIITANPQDQIGFSDSENKLYQTLTEYLVCEIWSSQPRQ